MMRKGIVPCIEIHGRCIGLSEVAGLFPQNCHLLYGSFDKKALCLASKYMGYRVVKTRRMPYLHKNFLSKEPYNEWLFCGKRPST